MKLCLVLSFLLATGLARRWSGPPRRWSGPPRRWSGPSRRWSGPPRIVFSRRGPPRPGPSRTDPPRQGPSRPDPPRPGPSRPDPPRPAPPSRPDPPRPGPVFAGATPGKNRPPPPPTVTRIVAAESQNFKYVWDENCKDDRPPFALGRWIRVTSKECPVAFEDPRFVYYDSFCGSEMADQHKEWYEDEVQGVWTYPEYGYCEALPTYLACPALEKCDDGPPPPPDN